MEGEGGGGAVYSDLWACVCHQPSVRSWKFPDFLGLQIPDLANEDGSPVPLNVTGLQGVRGGGTGDKTHRSEGSLAWSAFLGLLLYVHLLTLKGVHHCSHSFPANAEDVVDPH